MDTISSSLSSPETNRGRRALVLGGGGSTGNAWLIGVLAGLADSGVDLTTTERIIGTSAGATAAAQLTGATPAELLEAIRIADARSAHAEAARPAQAAGSANRPVVDHLERMHWLIAESTDAGDLRRRLGASALERLAASDGAWQDRWRSTVASRLPVLDWPSHEVLLTAVDATTGEPVVLDRHSGVDLADAVAASTSSGLPYRIGDRWLIDGGFRRNENADLAAGFESVLVLAPFSGNSFTPPEWGLQLDAQLAELRASGSQVATIYPGDEFDHLFGANAMNLALRPAAAEAGFARGKRFAVENGSFRV
ncbi:patatin [Pseudoclavibacter sp. AY1F1]|uniref:patatin-like phospholipase family protein n=1 Tax=Pseudoclavibacter sp. AY1F1 TaxID=2080583 RepID=UPI000CE7CEDC|nr:patatin-like phospholipase family protein [Pseudoclavibacter sp. AY1F1]PPF44097.1 patatin [Pseudoclavibacter sp. AY1F1]